MKIWSKTVGWKWNWILQSSSRKKRNLLLKFKSPLWWLDPPTLRLFLIYSFFLSAPPPLLTISYGSPFPFRVFCSLLKNFLTWLFYYFIIFFLRLSLNPWEVSSSRVNDCFSLLIFCLYVFTCTSSVRRDVFNWFRFSSYLSDRKVLAQHFGSGRKQLFFLRQPSTRGIGEVTLEFENFFRVRREKG